jgi:hypothetical protein
MAIAAMILSIAASSRKLQIQRHCELFAAG